MVIIIRKKELEKAIKHIDSTLKKKIKKQIKKIIENPEIGEFLHYTKGIRKIYISPFRLLYFYDKEKNIIYLLEFEHRDIVYKNIKK